MMTSAQVVETSVNVTNNSPSLDYSHPDDQTTQTTETPGFKPFTTVKSMTAGARMARDKIFFCDFQNIFLDFTSIFGLQTIFVFVKNLFVDPIILLGFVIVFEI